jgi:hypothetical protein
MNRPDESEFDPYYLTYTSLVGEEDIIEILGAQSEALNKIFAVVDDSRGTYAYAPEKWTIKEVLSHLIDGERIFAYRMLRISRCDRTPIEGFEQDGYIEYSNANNRSFSELLEEFELQRRSNVLLLQNVSDEGSVRTGTANGKEITVRAIAYIMAGHVRHHFNILRERYQIG